MTEFAHRLGHIDGVCLQAWLIQDSKLLCDSQHRVNVNMPFEKSTQSTWASPAPRTHAKVLLVVVLFYWVLKLFEVLALCIGIFCECVI